jgi:NTE family protein
MRIWSFLVVFGTVMLSACVTFQPHYETGALNRPIPIPDVFVDEIASPGSQIFTPRLKQRFVGLALSGGGSRAANFSAAVLESLDQVGILKNVDAISSVSGGGLPGAYYALHGQATDWALLKTKLSSDLWSMTLRKWIAPWNLPNAVFSSQTKTDLLADVLDEVLFDGKTYKDLPRHSPIFLANATDLTSGGQRVVLSSDYFVGELHSSMRNFRIANAVAISAAFPGVFDSATLERFRPVEIWVPLAGSKSWDPSSFIHLIDGGASDNLGVETLWDAALTQLYGNGFDSMPDHFDEKPFVLLSVDADAPNTNALFERYADDRRFLDRIFNSNVFGGIDALFAGRRRENLIKMGMGQTVFPTTTYESFSDSQQRYVQSKRISKFKVPVSCKPYWGRYRCFVDYSEPIGESKKLFFTGMVWHISLDEIASIAGLSLNFEQSDVLKKPRRLELVRLQRLVTQIKTHFKLVGPLGCSQRQLQDGLYAAARILVLEDEASRDTICDILGETKITDDMATCKKTFSATKIALDIESVEGNFSISKMDSPGNLPVRCAR